LKRALLLVLVAAILLLPAIPNPSTNTKVTPKVATWTDVVETQGEINRDLAYLVRAESERKEVTPTPTPPPSPTPEATLAPEESEPSEEIEAAGEIRPQGEVEPQGETEPPTEIAPLEETNITSVLSDGQIIEGAWITHFDCDIEGNCEGHTASGTYLTEGGPFAACDTDYWPFGTKMTIVGDPNGYVWVCVDVGPAIVGPVHWDVWFYYRADGEKYLDEIGGDTATIKILPP